MIATSILLAALATGFSDRDNGAAMLYVESFSATAVFDVCKPLFPAERAEDFDHALEKWRKRNNGLITRGKTVVTMQAEHDHFDVDKRLAQKSAEAVRHISDLAPEARTKQCEAMLKSKQSG